MQPNIRTTNRLSGGQLITGTGNASGNFSSIDVLAAAKFNVLTGNVSAVANTDSAIAPSIPVGSTIDGFFTAITLHSGTVIAYNK
jgi:hypothetical protein